MSRLSEDVYQEGLGLTRAQNLPGLMGWCRTHTPHMDLAVVEQTFRTVFSLRDVAQGVRFFEAAFKDYDPMLERIRIGARLFGYGFVTLGLLGGIIYLIRVILG